MGATLIIVLTLPCDQSTYNTVQFSLCTNHRLPPRILLDVSLSILHAYSSSFILLGPFSQSLQYCTHLGHPRRAVTALHPTPSLVGLCTSIQRVRLRCADQTVRLESVHSHSQMTAAVPVNSIQFEDTTIPVRMVTAQFSVRPHFSTALEKTLHCAPQVSLEQIRIDSIWCVKSVELKKGATALVVLTADGGRRVSFLWKFPSGIGNWI